MHRKQVISSGQLGILTVEEGILSSGRPNGQYISMNIYTFGRR